MCRAGWRLFGAVEAGGDAPFAKTTLHVSMRACVAPTATARRWTGLTDHHFLHYFVTIATALHVWLLLSTGAVEDLADAAAAEAATAYSGA